MAGSSILACQVSPAFAALGRPAKLVTSARFSQGTFPPDATGTGRAGTQGSEDITPFMARASAPLCLLGAPRRGPR